MLRPMAPVFVGAMVMRMMSRSSTIASELAWRTSTWLRHIPARCFSRIWCIVKPEGRDGGPGGTASGDTSNVTQYLEAGGYIWICPVEDSTGMPHFGRGRGAVVRRPPFK